MIAHTVGCERIRRMGALFPRLKLEVDRMVVLHFLVKLFDPHPKGVTIR
jgi:hypothetical protein